MPSGTPLALYGAGLTTDTGTMQDMDRVLGKAHLSVYPGHQCKEEYDVDTDVEFCSVSTETGVEPCSGDSGGPIIDMEGHLAGIYVASPNNGLHCHPVAFANLVTGARGEWIIDNLCELSDYCRDYPECKKHPKCLVKKKCKQ